MPRLTRAKLLTWDEEVSLANRIRAGGRDGEQARHQLVEANMRLVITVAKNYRSRSFPFEDLVQEGAIGLITAAERFDPGRGYRFSTCATHWIRQAISRAIDNKAKAIRIPAHVTEAQRKLERARAELRSEGVDDPTVEQLSSRTGLSVRRVNGLLQTAQEPVSLDGLVGGADGATLASLVTDATSANPQDEIVSAEMRGAVRRLMEILDPRQREIMRNRFGFDQDTTVALQAIGHGMQISRERVRQIEQRAMLKLKCAARRENLRSWVSD